MSNTFPSSPDHNDTWDNPTTGESFKFDRHRGWINTKGVRFDGDTMTGTLVLPDTRINGGLLSADGESPAFDIDGWIEQEGEYTENELGMQGIAYGEGRFVSIGSPRKLAYNKEETYNQSRNSIDGINWNVANFEPVNQWLSVAYGNGRFVGVAISNGKMNDGSSNGNTIDHRRVVYSDDGINWQYVDNIDQNEWRDVAFGDGKFVAVASAAVYNKGTNERIMYSEDGINWTGVKPPEYSNRWFGVTYGGGKWIASATSGTNRILYSEDAITWNTARAPLAMNWNGVAYGNGIWVGVANNYEKDEDVGKSRVMYSTDAINWSSGSGASEDGWQKVRYANGKFVAVARTGENRVMYSEDGMNWICGTGGSTSESGSEWRDLVYGDDKWVAVSSKSNRSGYAPTMVIQDPSNVNRSGVVGAELKWNNEKVVVQQSSRTMTSSLSQLSSTISNRAGRAKYLQDSAPPETQTIELSEDSSETIDLTYDNGELWYQPSTNTLHIRDSDDWVALFQ